MHTLLFLLQVAAAASAATDTLSAITLRNGDRLTRLPIQRVEQGAMVSAERLAVAFGGVVRRHSPIRYTVSLLGVELELSPGASLVRVKEQVVPLPTPPRVRGVDVLVPLALVTDALPRLVPAPGIEYDATLRELRRVAPVAVAVAHRPTPVAETPPAALPAPVRSETTLVRPAPPKAKARPVVIIDPGHGGPDRGMKGPLRSRNKVHEADITLQIGKRLRDALSRSGVDVIMTRTTDTLISLADRGRIANDHKADLFLSLHVNAANPRWRRPGDARGYETYFLSEARTDDARRVEELENSSIQYEVDSLPSDGGLSFILNDMKQNESLRESQLLADAVQAGMGSIHPGPSRGVKQAGFRVLVAAIVPAVLVEVGFGTNVAEARYLASDSGQRALANAIAKATLGYLTTYERRRTQPDTTH